MPKKKKNVISKIKKSSFIKPYLNEESTFGNFNKILDEEDIKIIQDLKTELTDNYHKNQVYRTDTEARISVLNDIKFPTLASKYWQAVREQSMMFEEAITEAYHLRHLNLQIFELEEQIKELKKQDPNNVKIKIKLLKKEYKIDTKKAEKNNITRSLKWRIKECQVWSKIKEELNDGSFDTMDVNTHQGLAYKHYWASRVKALGSESNSSDIITSLGSLISTEKLLDKETNIVKSFRDADNSLIENPNPTQEHINNLENTILGWKEKYKNLDADNINDAPIIGEATNYIESKNIFELKSPMENPSTPTNISSSNNSNSWYE